MKKVICITLFLATLIGAQPALASSKSTHHKATAPKPVTVSEIRISNAIKLPTNITSVAPATVMPKAEEHYTVQVLNRIRVWKAYGFAEYWHVYYTPNKHVYYVVDVLMQNTDKYAVFLNNKMYPTMADLRKAVGGKDGKIIYNNG